MEMENAMQQDGAQPTSQLSNSPFSISPISLIVANPFEGFAEAGRGSSGEFQDSGNRYHGQ